MKQPSNTNLLVSYYKQFLADEDVAGFVKRTTLQYTTATLERLLAMSRRTSRQAAATALGMLGDFTNNSSLGRALKDRDRGVRMLAEVSIRKIWQRSGKPFADQKLAQIKRLIVAGENQQAVDESSVLIESLPTFAEAWNQRAIAYYHLERYDNAIYDCHQTLELNPCHFGAAAGMGQCYLLCGDYEESLTCFRRALRMNGRLSDVRATVDFLERILNPDQPPKPRKNRKKRRRDGN